MSKHHDELAIQFELLIGVQKELKESFDIAESTWQNKKELPCLREIDQWEEEVINRIRQIAAKARTTANETMTKNIFDIRRRLKHLAFDMQQRQQEGNHLDNDIIEIKNRLEQLNNTIHHINDKIHINYTATNKVDWSSLIYVTTEKKLEENYFNYSDFHDEQESPQDKIWNNLRKLLKNKHNRDYKNHHSNFKRHTSTLFEPIVLTSFDSSTYSQSQQNSNTNFDATSCDNSQLDSFVNDEVFNYKTFTSIDLDQSLPQGTDA